MILWWLLFSRARWYERLGAIVLMIAVMIPEKWVVHPSISGAAMGYLSYIVTIPTLSLALVAWAAVSRRLAPGARAAAAIAAVVLGCLPWMVVRTGGINADGRSDFHWRWTKTPRSGCSLWPPRNPRPALRLAVAAELPKRHSRRHPTRPSTRLGQPRRRDGTAPPQHR